MKLRQICNHGRELLSPETLKVLGQGFKDDRMETIACDTQSCENCGIIVQDLDLDEIDNRRRKVSPIAEAGASNFSYRPIVHSIASFSWECWRRVRQQLRLLPSRIISYWVWLSNRLDLTAASRVHLLEPQWNPMAEEPHKGVWELRLFTYI